MNKIFILAVPIFFISCVPKNDFGDKNKIFHAAPQDVSGPGIFFELFKGNKYRLTNGGYLGGTSYTGTFSLRKDTITLNNLNFESKMSSNRLLIFRYEVQDSNYWKWKYGDKIEIWEWQDFEKQDNWNGSGDVYQLDSNNKPIKDAYHFRIAFDSLKN